MEELIRATAALIFVLSIILGMGWAFKRFTNSKANIVNKISDLRIVEWRGMDSRRKLAVVHWDGREHLLCLSQTDQCVVASRQAPVPDPELNNTPPPPVQAPNSLVEKMANAITKATGSKTSENS